MSFRVRYLPAAREDLERLYLYLIEHARNDEDLVRATVAMETIEAAIGSLRRTPFIYRKSDSDPFLRELVIPFGSSGYVALFDIVDAGNVTVAAVRHQLEDDYH